jgi:hypothetical protein
MWLGGGLWWVARRLFGNEGGFFALGLYCFCPAIVRLAVTPNNDLLAMWGLYGLVYTAIGVAHAMQGPRRKWRPRIMLLTVALGLTAAAHLLAAMLGFLAALIFMLYLAERRRGYVMQILIFSAIGALGHPLRVLWIPPRRVQLRLHRRRRRFWFSLSRIAQLRQPAQLPHPHRHRRLRAALSIGHRRSRYFGNTAPLLVVLALAPLSPLRP